MELTDFLKWASGPGAGVLAYFAVQGLRKWWKWFAALDAEVIRYWAAGVSGVIAIAAWTLLAAGTQTLPTGNWWDWFQKLFFIATSAFSLATLIQAPQLRGTMRVPKPEA